MMQHVIHALTRGSAYFELANVSFNHSELPGLGERSGKNIVEIGPVTGREVVDTDNVLTEGQQIRKEVGSDEASDTCNEPGFRGGRQTFAKAVVWCGDHELAVEGTRPADSGQLCAGARLPDHRRRMSRLSSAARQGIFYSGPGRLVVTYKSCDYRLLAFTIPACFERVFILCRGIPPFCGD